MAFKNVKIIKQLFEVDEKVWVSIDKLDCQNFDHERLFNYNGPAIIRDYECGMETSGERKIPYCIFIPPTLFELANPGMWVNQKEGEIIWVAPYAIKDSLGFEDE